MIQDNLYFSLDVEFKESGSMQNELHKEECTDMPLILGEALGNLAEAELLHAERFPNRRSPSLPRFLPWVNDCGKLEHSKQM
jgi:hypothetical protein